MDKEGPLKPKKAKGGSRDDMAILPFCLHRRSLDLARGKQWIWKKPERGTPKQWSQNQGKDQLQDYVTAMEEMVKADGAEDNQTWNPYIKVVLRHRLIL